MKTPLLSIKRTDRSTPIEKRGKQWFLKARDIQTSSMKEHNCMVSLWAHIDWEVAEVDCYCDGTQLIFPSCQFTLLNVSLVLLNLCWTIHFTRYRLIDSGLSSSCVQINLCSTTQYLYPTTLYMENNSTHRVYIIFPLWKNK